MDTSNLTPKKMRKGKNGKQGTRYYDSAGGLVAKICAHCDEPLPVAEFGKARQATDGLLSTCRECTTRTQKEYRRRPSVGPGKYTNEYRSRSDEEIRKIIASEHPTNTKTCPHCNQSKSLDLFYQNKVYSTGISTYCKTCTIDRAKGRQKNVAEEDPTYYSRNSKKAYKAYYARTDEQISSVILDRYPDRVKRCPHCKDDLSLDHWGPNRGTPDGLTRYCRPCDNEKKRIREKKSYEDHWKANNIPFECYVCQGPYDHSDHVIPEILGGTDDPRNRLPMCAYHNTSKNGTLLSQWLEDNHHDIMAEVIDRVVSTYQVRIEL